MIKNLIFDFGGVLYGIDYPKSLEEMAKLAVNPDKMKKMAMNDFIDIPQKFEKGEISETDFRAFLRNEYSMEGSDETLDKAFNAMLLGLSSESVPFLKEAKSNYKLALLSNTNSIHYNYFINDSSEMLSEFDHVFLSFKTGMRKPDENIFQFVLDKTGFLADESLFIDDGIRNIEGAKKLGIHGFLFSESSKLSDLLHSI